MIEIYGDDFLDNIGHFSEEYVERLRHKRDITEKPGQAEWKYDDRFLLDVASYE